MKNKILKARKFKSIINNLFVCNKENYSDGEKALASGYMEKWHTSWDETWNCETYHFIWKQKKHDFNSKAYPKLEPQYPLQHYGCAFVGVKVLPPHYSEYSKKYVDTYFVTWYSGDDDCGIDMSLTEDEWLRFKSFLVKNYRDHRLDYLLQEFYWDTKDYKS